MSPVPSVPVLASRPAGLCSCPAGQLWRLASPFRPRFFATHWASFPSGLTHTFIHLTRISWVPASCRHSSGPEIQWGSRQASLFSRRAYALGVGENNALITGSGGCSGGNGRRMDRGRAAGHSWVGEGAPWGLPGRKATRGRYPETSCSLWRVGSEQKAAVREAEAWVSEDRAGPVWGRLPTAAWRLWDLAEFRSSAVWALVPHCGCGFLSRGGACTAVWSCLFRVSCGSGFA